MGDPSLWCLGHGASCSLYRPADVWRPWKINMTQGWRFWSHSDPSVHYALGEFSDMNELRRAASSQDFKFLIADYDRVWESRGVTRTRDVIEKMQHLSR
jgi:hypothetical protein